MEKPLISQWLDHREKQAMIEKRLEEILKKDSQLTLSEYYALYQLNQQGSRMRQNDLGNYLCLSQSALSRLLDRLERKDPQLIQRKTCTDDKRGIYIGITNEGKRQLSLIEAKINTILTEYFI
jgi:DNA-binding MarR family transcriptional regulator